MLTVVNEDVSTPSGSSLLDEIVREDARRTLAAALAMIFTLVESAQQRWAANAPHRIALVRAEARCERGRLVGRPEAVAT